LYEPFLPFLRSQQHPLIQLEPAHPPAPLTASMLWTSSRSLTRKACPGSVDFSNYRLAWRLRVTHVLLAFFASLREKQSRSLILPLHPCFWVQSQGRRRMAARRNSQPQSSTPIIGSRLTPCDSFSWLQGGPIENKELCKKPTHISAPG